MGEAGDTDLEVFHKYMEVKNIEVDYLTQEEAC